MRLKAVLQALFALVLIITGLGFWIFAIILREPLCALLGIAAWCCCVALAQEVIADERASLERSKSYYRSYRK